MDVHGMNGDCCETTMYGKEYLNCLKYMHWDENGCKMVYIWN